LVTVRENSIFGLTGTNTPVKMGLAAGDHVIAHAAKGINGLVQTSVRLLAFSSQTMAWSEQPLNLYEQVQDRRVSTKFLLVRTDKHLYGFQASLGSWRVQDLDLAENGSGHQSQRHSRRRHHQSPTIGIFGL
jgi:hypothetical protein